MFQHLPIIGQSEEDTPEPLRDRPFNPWRIPTTDRAQDIVHEVIRQVENYERHHKLRQRRRRQADQTSFEAAVSAIICDLMHHHLTGQGDGVHITRSHVHLGQGGRYSPPAYTKALPDILDRLEAPEMGFVEQSLGHEAYFGPAKRTTLRAGKRLIDRIVRHDITLEDLGLSKDQEVILLKRMKTDHWDEGGLIDYRDTPLTLLYREQITAINDWLEKAELYFDEFILDANQTVDVTDRRLCRIFTRERFDNGGRLFGGFWQRLRKKHRLEGIAIGTEDVVELDFGQMAPRILYGLAKVEPRFTDSYLVPGFEMHRQGIKKVMNAMLFTTKPLMRMPQGVRNEFSARHRVQDVVTAIEAAHPAIKDMFFTDIGHELQFIESQILVDVLLKLRGEGIIALPIHDAVLVPASKVALAKDIMLSSFKHHTGIEGIVTEEGSLTNMNHDHSSSPTTSGIPTFPLCGTRKP